jgi:hypothetical protein
MDFEAGRYYPVSKYRRLVIDLMHFSVAVPSVTIERTMELGRLITARQEMTPQPTWSAIFTKAFSLVAARMPQLRTSYLKFPWHRFYEHPSNIATLSIDRQVGSERIVLYVHIAHPERLTLGAIDAVIHSHQELPLQELLSYRRAVRMSWVPWPLRRWLWWGSLNVLGPVRCHNFGTFGFTSLGAQGAGMLHLLPLLTSTLFYGLFDSSGNLQVRLSFDHRVLDGATAAAALAELEAMLVGPILEECRSGD